MFGLSVILTLSMSKGKDLLNSKARDSLDFAIFINDEGVFTCTLCLK